MIYIHPALINPFALAKLERETGLKAVATGPETPARLIDPTNRPAPCPRAWAGPHTHTPDGAA